MAGYEDVPRCNKDTQAVISWLIQSALHIEWFLERRPVLNEAIMEDITFADLRRMLNGVTLMFCKDEEVTTRGFRDFFGPLWIDALIQRESLDEALESFKKVDWHAVASFVRQQCADADGENMD